ncbi:MAG: sulfur carrier protein ThiS [Bacillota bacterium]
MEITLNGEVEELQEEVNLEELLESKDLELDRLVIEYNQEIVSREEWSKITVQDGDVLEVLRFVGGG